DDRPAGQRIHDAPERGCQPGDRHRPRPSDRQYPEYHRTRIPARQPLADWDTAMIKVQGLTKLYGTRTALHNVSFEVPRGEIFGFVGPNGAGKTTTMRILAALLDPTEGQAFIDGVDVTREQGVVHDPAVLLLDDPASGLDPRARVEMREILRELRGMGKTILISSHILPELTELCTMIGIIDHGEMRATGRVHDVIQRLTSGRRL